MKKILVIIISVISINSSAQKTFSAGGLMISMDETIGEIVGVVREDGYALGIQSLNAKTTGGKLKNPDGNLEGSAIALFGCRDISA
ncbi:MAG: hypothetical protein U9N72_09410 [Bacteroidota bacterium]|nr:hypothetical protein [Bacteroidota bacterium]